MVNEVGLWDCLGLEGPGGTSSRTWDLKNLLAGGCHCESLSPGQRNLTLPRPPHLIWLVLNQFLRACCIKGESALWLTGSKKYSRQENQKVRACCRHTPGSTGNSTREGSYYRREHCLELWTLLPAQLLFSPSFLTAPQFCSGICLSTCASGKAGPCSAPCPQLLSWGCGR